MTALGHRLLTKPCQVNKALLRNEINDFVRKLRLKYKFWNMDRPTPELYQISWYNVGKTESMAVENLVEKKKGKPYFAQSKDSQNQKVTSA